LNAGFDETAFGFEAVCSLSATHCPAIHSGMPPMKKAQIKMALVREMDLTRGEGGM